MDKFSFIGLWDVYSGLLTKTQQEITNLYFNLDLTVSEIAAEKGISRQAVSDCLKSSRLQLEEFERKLHIFRRLQRDSLGVSFMLTDANRWAEEFKAAHPQFSAEADRLLGILAYNYSAEVEAELLKPESIEKLNADYTQAVYGHKKTGEE